MKDEVVKGSNISKTACYMTLAVTVAATFGTVPGLAEDAVRPGEFVIERPTLICLGFQWYTSGDDNKNAKGTVKFRRVGDAEWKAGLDLWRLNGQRCIGYRGEEHDFYEPPQMFAGSLFDLEPDTQYECALTMSDPDGVKGTAERRVFVRTRREPQPPADSRILHLGGAKSDFADFRTAVDALTPGDTLLVHRGVYRLSRPSDADYLDNHAFTVNPKDGGRVFRSLGNALFGDDRWTQDRCGRSSKRRNDAVRPGDTIIVHRGETLLDHRHSHHAQPVRGHIRRLLVQPVRDGRPMLLDPQRGLRRMPVHV